MKNAPKVLVAGATGYLGRYVAQEFKNQGFWVRALTRNADSLNGLKGFVDDIFVGEVTDPNSLKGICSGIDIVFSSIGITRQKDGLTYMDVDYQGNRNLMAEAQMEAVNKFIYVSVFNAEYMKRLHGVRAKRKFEDELKMSGLDYSIIYPNGFFSDMLEYLKMARKGRGYVFGTGGYKINPIHGSDLAEVCVDATVEDRREIEIGGPETYTHNEILMLAFKVLAKPPKVSRIPIWVKHSLLTILRIITTPKIYGPVEFFMTVLATDMVAPGYGGFRLWDYFLENKDAI